jgi:anti-sigma B factor antagonist
MPHLRCSTKSLPEGILLHVEGDIDLATAPLLTACLTAAFARDARVIVDLNAVSYLDSAALHILARTAARQAGRFIVLQSAAHVRRLLDILGMTALLPTAISLEDARQYLREHYPPAERGGDSAGAQVADDAE